MNQKKCPKCGESNPAEAVMCWACYTPLGGATVAAAGATGGAAVAGAPGVMVGDDSDKKAIPPWQIAVIAVALLLAVGFGVKTLMGSGGSEVVDPGMLPEDPGMMDPADPGGMPAPVNPAPQPGPGQQGGGGGGGGSVQPAAAPFTMVAPPNPLQDWGVMAIVPTQQNISSQRAAQLAAFARRQMRGGRNRAFHIYVFTDQQAGQMFAQYQAKRRGSVLTENDYLQLGQLWTKCVLRYEYRNGKEYLLYPNRTPTGWWYTRN